MIQIPLSQVKDDLSRYLRLAEKEDVVITRHGIPAGILIGFEDPEAWWEELLLRDPSFSRGWLKRAAVCAPGRASVLSGCARNTTSSQRQPGQRSEGCLLRAGCHTAAWG